MDLIYQLALDHIDEVINTIRASETTDEAQENLIKQWPEPDAPPV